MKYKLIKSVRYRGKDLEAGEVIDITNEDDLVNLKQVNAIEKYVEPPEVVSPDKNSDDEKSLKIGPKKK